MLFIILKNNYVIYNFFLVHPKICLANRYEQIKLLFFFFFFLMTV